MPTHPAVSPTDPSIEDNWHDGYYELTIKLGQNDDVRLDAALNALWTSAGLSRPFRNARPGQGSAEVELSTATLLEGRLNSIASVPELGSTLCSVIVVREERYESGVTHYGADWLDLCLPLGALANLDRRVGAYPFDESASSRAWREPIELWFEGVGRAVFDIVRFEHAVTGFEVSGVEPSEVRTGWVTLLRPSPAGELVVETITSW